MTGAEVMATPLCEMLDMISALAIYNGTAKLKRPAHEWTFDEVLALE